MKKQDKYNFILELLNKKNISNKQRNYIQKLSKREFAVSPKVKKDNILQKQNTFNKKHSKPIPKDIKYISPTKIHNFLLEYNQNRILKTTCHLIDSNELEYIKKTCGTSEYNFGKHYELIIENFNKIDKDCYASTNIKTRIKAYLTGTDFKNIPEKWSSDNIKINWNCSELKKWCEKNINIPPNPDNDIKQSTNNIGFRFKPFKAKSTQQTIATFSNLVIHFKHLFHIRYDNSLKSIIENINKVEKWNDIINFKIDSKIFWENLELFTDVDKVTQAYKIIITLILDVSKNNQQKPSVKLSFKEDRDKNIIFSIHHINSVYGKTIQNTIERRGEIYTNLIENQINGVCDLYLKAEFGCHNCAEINLWNNQYKRESKPLKTFKGVEHILKFRK